MKYFFRVSLVISILTAFFLIGCRSENDLSTPDGDNEPVKEQPASKTPFHAGYSLSSFMTDDFTGSGACILCHERMVDAKDNDVTIDKDWRSTMMANAARDPLWQAKVSSEVKRYPSLGDLIEDKCSTCHMPMARTQAVTDNTSKGMFGDGFLNQENSLHEAAMDGVSCTLCHQIEDMNLGEESTFSGNFPIDTSTQSPERTIYGPFPVTNPVIMKAVTSYIPVQGEQTSGSELCGTCHTLYTSYVDSSGTVLGKFPEQTPYLEWLASKYGDGDEDDIECQICHMPAADGPVAISEIPDNLNEYGPFSQHQFIGGNSIMLKIFRDNIEEMGLTASTEQFNLTLDRTIKQLENDTASLSITGASLKDSVITATLEIENRAGHKLPTGFPSRNVWIHFTVLDSLGNIVFESGKPLINGGIEGDDSMVNMTRYEPHYELITSPEQVQIYQTVMQNSDGKVTYTLLRAAGYAKDNRLSPAGYDKQTVHSDVGVYGNAAGDADFDNGSDRITYRVSIGKNKWPYTVRAELLYQTIAYSFLEDLKITRTDQISTFTGYYEAADKTPVVIASDSETVE